MDLFSDKKSSNTILSCLDCWYTSFGSIDDGLFYRKFKKSTIDDSGVLIIFEPWDSCDCSNQLLQKKLTSLFVGHIVLTKDFNENYKDFVTTTDRIAQLPTIAMPNGGRKC